MFRMNIIPNDTGFAIDPTYIADYLSLTDTGNFSVNYSGEPDPPPFDRLTRRVYMQGSRATYGVSGKSCRFYQIEVTNSSATSFFVTTNLGGAISVGTQLTTGVVADGFMLQNDPSGQTLYNVYRYSPTSNIYVIHPSDYRATIPLTGYKYDVLTCRFANDVVISSNSGSIDFGHTLYALDLYVGPGGVVSALNQAIGLPSGVGVSLYCLRTPV